MGGWWDGMNEFDERVRGAGELNEFDGKSEWIEWMRWADGIIKHPNITLKDKKFDKKYV